MSDSKTRREVELLVATLDDEPLTDGDAIEAVKRLGIDTKAWAADMRKRVAVANAAERKERFDAARVAFERELQELEERRAEPSRSLAEQRAELKRLVAQIPPEVGASMHALKFEHATEEELAELIKSLRHMLADDEKP